jgi:hypothetical protein
MLLDRAHLLSALQALDEELGAAGIRGEVFVVGGAAMALAYDARQSTVDVDAVFAPSRGIREAAERVAASKGLEPDWLNDGAKAFMPGEDPERIGVYEGEHLSVAAASARYLLAMKLLASRVERDRDDINLLYKMCGFTTVEEGLDLVESSYPSHAIGPRVQFLLEEMFPTSQEIDRNRDSHRRDSPGLEI